MLLLGELKTQVSKFLQGSQYFKIFSKALENSDQAVFCSTSLLSNLGFSVSSHFVKKHLGLLHGARGSEVYFQFIAGQQG